MKRLDIALAWQRAGHYVLPGKPGTKSSRVAYVALNISDTIEAMVREWWTAHPDDEVLVIPGRNRVRPLTLIDVDWHPGGVDGREWLREQPDQLGIDIGAGNPSSSGNGEHHWKLASPRVERNGNPSFPGVDIKSFNGLARVTHYAEAIEPTTVTEVIDDAFVTEYGGGGTDAAPDGSVAEWMRRVRDGKPSKAMRRIADSVTSEGMSRSDMLAATDELIKAGNRGERGAATAYAMARATYLENYPGHAREWDTAADGSVRRLGLPPVTFVLTKEERKALRARRAATDTTNGARLLDDVRAQLERFVSFPSDAAAIAVTCWVAHTHILDRFDSTPRLAVLSPEPGSGKSRLLEVLAQLTHDPVETVNTSAAYLARRISGATTPPTVLFDEVDTLFGVRARDAASEELRGILNSGHRRNGVYNRAAVRGKEVVLEEFSTFAAVAMAGLGDIPDTVRARSVIVPMRRRAPGEVVEPYRERQNGSELAAVRSRLAAWTKRVSSKVGAPWPVMPDGITDRDADVWEPLLAVADAAGGHWPANARQAALGILEDARDRPATLGVRLLSDVRRAFGDEQRLAAVELLGRLLAIEDAPWADLGGRGPIDSRYLGRMFDGYGIVRSHSVRFDPTAGGTRKGWERHDFSDAWLRYLPTTTTGTPI
ncbi:DUF3631 domain-containing protein [Curtobacterium sp. USHLN213]|uniref:DUF3631 domain-containing protein n=1 Tax=Curtobacterium sp. USHLN213 TaxID=3081255 RepID=UPI0030192CEC